MAFLGYRTQKDFDEINRKEMERKLLMKLVEDKLAVPEAGRKFSMGPDGFSLSGSTEPVTFETLGKKKGKKAYFTKSDKGQYIPFDVPEGYEEVDIVGGNPPGDKESPQEKAAREVMQAVTKWQTDNPGEQLPPALEKSARAMAPILDLEPVEAQGKEKKSFFGKSTGEREPGTVFFKPKGSVTEDEWDTIAERELKAAGAPLTPANLAEAKRQLKAQATRKKK